MSVWDDSGLVYLPLAGQIYFFFYPILTVINYHFSYHVFYVVQ